MEDLYSKRKIEKAGVTLEVRNVSTLDGAVRDVSLDVHRGEILGIAGLVGSGKELLGKALFGAVPASGSVVIAGKKLKMGDPRAAMDAGIGFVPEDRKLESLLLTRGTRANLSLPWSRGGATFNRLGFLRPRTERKLTVDWVERFRVRVPSVDHPIVNLSGGNQQKVVLARLVRAQPEGRHPHGADPGHRRGREERSVRVHPGSRCPGSRRADGVLGDAGASRPGRPDPGDVSRRGVWGVRPRGDF
ncbi:MAG: ATP-binding cassette domain-containing protein [Actinobacteria bacterium]|nr:ATP-binding cassette domain-containing protein [Actinomycetota bacterium]